MAPSLIARLRRSGEDAHQSISNACQHVPLLDMIYHNWHLGFTSFGGPAVHFQIFHKRFVEKYQWLDEQAFQEMMALCQALPGPGSTKMLYGINAQRYGFWIGLLAFAIWSVPMAIAAFGLSLGIANIDERLPGPAYALLSGLNAATVGIVALAAYQLSMKAITDPLTRILVFLGGTAGMLYNALWYFPVLMVGGALAAVTHDLRLWRYLNPTSLFKKRARDEEQQLDVQLDELPELPPASTSNSGAQGSVKRRHADASSVNAASVESGIDTGSTSETRPTPPLEYWKMGLAVIAGFFATLIVIMVFRGYRKGESRGFDLFANLYLAGTIIFGGGPVVIPLLREYVVAEGWVSPRDFLLGLALIQAFPGPNFNFAVYLGGLAVRSATNPLPSAVGSLIGFLGIFGPGIILHTGTIGLWKALQKRRVVRSSLRGIHAAAVGLVFTAVYRLFQIGYIDQDFRSGTSLARDPWWVVILATSFVGGLNFKLSPPLAIVLGAIMGLIWYAVART